MFKGNFHRFDDWHFKNVDWLEISVHPLSPLQQESKELSKCSGLYPPLRLEDHLVLGSTEDVDTWILLLERCHINFKWRFKLGRLTALLLRVLSGDLSLSPTEKWLEMQTCRPLALRISTQIHSDFSALTLTFETPRPHSLPKAETSSHLQTSSINAFIFFLFGCQASW